MIERQRKGEGNFSHIVGCLLSQQPAKHKKQRKTHWDAATASPRNDDMPKHAGDQFPDRGLSPSIQRRYIYQRIPDLCPFNPLRLPILCTTFHPEHSPIPVTSIALIGEIRQYIGLAANFHRITSSIGQKWRKRSSCLHSRSLNTRRPTIVGLWSTIRYGM